MSWLRVLATRVLNSLGYDVRRVPSSKIHTAAPGADPVAFEYLPSLRGRAIFDIPVEDARAFHSLALPLRPQEHPFVRAIDRALRDENPEEPRQSLQSVLADYYGTVRPSSASEAVGLGDKDAPGLRGIPPPGYLLPWWDKTIEETIQGRSRAMRLVGLENGVTTSVEEGLTAFGPVKEGKLALEVDRLHKLLQLVKSSGFVPFRQESPMKVSALRRNGAYKWLIEQGQHRFAMAAALGVRTVPAMVSNVVRREDAPHWPQVVSGVFTEAGALSVFDRIFDAVPAPACNAWIGSSETRKEPAECR